MSLSGTDPSLLRLAHRVLWPGFTGTAVPGWLRSALESGLAGAVYFAHNIDSGDPGQVRRLSDEIHDAAPGALIGVDEEGGIVTRLEARRGSSVPGNAVLGRIDDPQATEQTARWVGELVARAGIDVDLAPDADVNSNPLNPVIGVRSFHADSAVVARHTAAYVRGIQAAGVAACAKHFPGHGDTVSDSHLEPATAEISLDELAEVHLPPFAAAVEAGVKAIMSAHIRIPALGELPATVNARSLGLIRDLGFDGVIVTDALDMAAIRSTMGTGPGAVAALRAGADLLCIGNPVSKVDSDGRRGDEQEFLEPLRAVYEALRSGELPVSRVEEAAARLDALAAWRAEQVAAPETSGDPGGADLALRAAQVLGDVRLAAGPILVVDCRARRTIAVGDAADFFTLALREHRAVERTAVGGTETSVACGIARNAAAQFAGEVVLLVNQPQTSDFEAATATAVLSARPDAVLVHAGWPADEPFPAQRSIVTFGASRAGAEAAARILVGA